MDGGGASPETLVFNHKGAFSSVSDLKLKLLQQSDVLRGSSDAPWKIPCSLPHTHSETYSLLLGTDIFSCTSHDCFLYAHGLSVYSTHICTATRRCCTVHHLIYITDKGLTDVPQVCQSCRVSSGPSGAAPAVRGVKDWMKSKRDVCLHVSVFTLRVIGWPNDEK